MAEDPADPQAGIPETPIAEGLLGRPPGRAHSPPSSRVKDTHLSPLSKTWPWAGDKRAADKTHLFKSIYKQEGGAPLSTIVRRVFDGATGEIESADYQLARRFFQKSEFFRMRKVSGLYWVERTLEGLSLTHSMQSAKTRQGSGVGPDAPPERDSEAVARARLSRLGSLEDELRGELLGDLAAKRSGMEGRFLTFSRRSETIAERGEHDHLLVPLESRFSSENRAADQYQEFATAWERASARHERGCVLTVTTAAGRHESLLDSAEELMDDLNRLRSWLAYDPDSGPSRPGYRPPSIVVPEFTDSGLAHAHIVFFGVSWLTQIDSLRAYVSGSLGRGEQLHLDRIHKRGDQWRWSNDPDQPNVHGRTPRAYLSEPLQARKTAAEATSDELKAASSALGRYGVDVRPEEIEGLGAQEERDLVRGRRCWKAALYWATGLRFFTRSPELRESEESLPHVAEWELATIATWEELPRSVVGDAEVISSARPPPQVRPPGTPPPGASDGALEEPADLASGWTAGEPGVADDD